MNKDLKLGDVVVLKSGGTNMTVTQIRLGSNPGEVVVECTWFEGPCGDQKEKLSSYPIEALKKVSQQAKKVTTSPEIKEGLKKIKSPLPNESQSGFDQLVSLNAADELAKLLSNKEAKIRQLAAAGLAKLKYFPALPQLIDGLQDNGKKRVRAAVIKGVDDLIGLFGETAFKEVLSRIPKKGIHDHERDRWVKALATCMNENQANDSLQESLNEFKANSQNNTEAASGHTVRRIVNDHFEIILRASIASKRSLSPQLLIQAATAYGYRFGNESTNKIRNHIDVAEWLAESGVNYSSEVIELISGWARTAAQNIEYDLREGIIKRGSDWVAGYCIRLLKVAFKLNALNNEHLDSIVGEATLPELKPELSKFRMQMTLND